MHRRNFLFLATVIVPGVASARDIAVADAARHAVAGLAAGSATTERVTAVIGWTNRSLEWTATDYQKRTAQEVLDRGGGNCAEQAMLVSAMLEPLGIRVRTVREINIQPENPGRQERAARLVEARGPQLSVFGLRHNDHAWIEYWNAEADEWTPADPTLDLVGYDAWITARLGFGERPQHAILPSRDMLAPIAVASRTESGFEPRSRRYLVDGFARAVPEAPATPEWPRWTEAVLALEPLAVGAFQSRVNLHAEAERIAALGAIYEAMRASARAA